MLATETRENRDIVQKIIHQLLMVLSVLSHIEIRLILPKANLCVRSNVTHDLRLLLVHLH